MATPSGQPYRAIRLGNIAGGINDFDSELSFGSGAMIDRQLETPSAKNVDFDGDFVAAARGSIKFGNQTAPRSAIRTRVDKALSPLYIAPAQAVPLRGYGYLPYSPETDLGGRGDSEGSLTANPQTQTYHNRRGRTFELNVSFQIPPEEKLYEIGTRGAGAPAVGAEAAGFANVPFDEALDECVLIIQKGGDRTAPLSWALGIVNIGAGTGLASAPAIRVSNYALVLMWLDTPQWGQPTQAVMRYNLTSGALPTAGPHASNALRAVIIHKYVEPLRTYNLAVQVKLDTGTPGGVATNTAWNDDGFVKVFGCEDGGAATLLGSFVDNGGGGVATNMEVLKGPQDSMRYLSKYGFRYFGQDAMFLGLGYRQAPFKTAGFVANGYDSAPLKNGGMQMLDVSNVATNTLYGIGAYTLVTQHTAAAAYIEVNHQALVVGNVIGQFNHFGSAWQGYGNGVLADANVEALRGYYLAFPNDAPAGIRGARVRIGNYTEVGASFRIDVSGAAFVAWAFADSVKTLVQCFRWNQRDLVIGEVRIWGTPRAYQDESESGARRGFSLRSGIELDDTTEPDIANLIACWPCDDAEGGTLRELVVGGYRTGALAPFSLAEIPGGIEGEKMVFFSGEGEAPCLDLSTNPVFMREVRSMLAGQSQGFAIELAGVFTEAFWPITTTGATLPDRDSAGAAVTGTTMQFAPTILSWDVKDAVNSGGNAAPRPLIALTFGGAVSNNSTFGSKIPAMPSVEVAPRTDGQDVDPIVPSDLNPWFQTAPASAFSVRYDPNAPWVGQYVRIQIGVQSTGTANQYNVYISMSPKDAFLPASGDPSDAEFAYWTAGGGTYSPNANYFTAAQLRIDPKEFVRSVITLGRWNPGSTKGYCDMQPRMFVDKVRFYGASASGALPTANGGILTNRNGKLEGTDAMPQSLLSRADLLRQVGPGLTNANMTEASMSVVPTSGARFFTDAPRTTLNAVLDTFLYVPGDEEKILKQDTDGTVQEQFYRVNSVLGGVATSGAQLSLGTAYEGATRAAASAYSLRILGYTAFEDDVRDKQLTLGAGSSFEPGVTTVADVILTDELWLNIAPLTGDWRLRVYSPLGRTSLFDVFPAWTRGLVAPRKNPILGLCGHNTQKYAAVRGALYEVDDRWREDAPRGYEYSLDFRAKKFIANIVLPEQNDRATLSSSSTAAFKPSAADSYMTVYDAWISVDELGQYQTILWIGNPNSDPELNASSTGHQLSQIVRLNHGRPELCFGSTAFYTGTTVPEKGLYIARSATAIEPGSFNHVRWYVLTRTNAAGQQLLTVPYLKINGKHSAVLVNATDNGITVPLTGDWLRVSTLVSGIGLTVAVGAAHDSYKSPDANTPFTASALGINVKPQRIQCWMHGLAGRLSRLAISQQPKTGTSEPEDFDPFSVDYVSAGFTMQLDLFPPKQSVTPGVGHKAEDEPSGLMLAIVSHPFISRWHEFGMSELPVSFAEYGQQLIVANGGRPARLQTGIGGLAGVQPPNTTPGFEVQRFPLWRKNFHSTTGINDQNDPIAPAAVGAADQIDHYDNRGNNWLLQRQLNAAGDAEILWSKDSAGTRYFGFKAYVRPRSVVGRQVLFARRDHTEQGGPFVEMMDGKLRVGWYDLLLKKEVWAETTESVFAPGYWHYINVRKSWPPQHALDGNWTNEYWSNGNVRLVQLAAPLAGTFLVGEQVAAGAVTGRVTRSFGAAATQVEVTMTTAGPFVGLITGATSAATGTFVSQTRPMYDKAVVRRFRHANDGALGTNACWPLLTKGAGRNCLSFTTTSIAQTAGCTGTGPVTAPGITFTGAAGGNVTVSGYGAGTFDDLIHADMLGMYFEWASGLAKGRTYRLTTIGAPPTNTFVCVNVDTGAAEDFAALGYGAATAGQVFSGIGMKKSEDFDISNSPDKGLYTVQAFGAPDAALDVSGVAPFDGEFASFGWTNIVDDNGEDARVFENVNTAAGGAATADPVEVGTDTLLEDITAIGAFAGDLRFDAWVTGGAGVNLGTFFCADGQTYAGAGGGVSTQPNVNLTIAKDTSPVVSVNAGDCVWQYLQAPLVFTGQRYVRVRFFDPAQNQLSNPGEPLTIKPEGEDNTNPSGQVRYLITDLPQSRQGNGLEVWIYMSIAGGDTTTMFRVSRVPSGTREVSVFSPEDDIEAGPPIDFESGEPPRCELVASDGLHVFYGALEAQPDGYVFTRAGFPVSVIYAKASRFNSGEGSKITMLRSLDGFVLVAKRRALGAIYINDAGNPVLQTITEGEGCVANQSAVSMGNRIAFLSEKGIVAVSRAGVTNLGLPVFVARKLQRFFLKGEFDQESAFRCSAAINRSRNQYVMTVKLSDDDEFRERIAMDFSQEIAGTPVSTSAPGGYRFSRYREPSVTCLASVESEGGGLAKMIGGTADGFVVWMDRVDTSLSMLGPIGSIWGFSKESTSLTAGSVTSAPLAGNNARDLVQEGMRGAPFRFTDTQGIIRTVPVLFATSSRVYFDEKVEFAAQVNEPVTFGQTYWTWETPWMDMGTPEAEKTGLYLDLAMTLQSLGNVRVRLYADRNELLLFVDKTLDIINPQPTVPLESTRARWFKARLSAPDFDPDGAAEIVQLVWRVVDVDQT